MSEITTEIDCKDVFFLSFFFIFFQAKAASSRLLAALHANRAKYPNMTPEQSVVR